MKSKVQAKYVEKMVQEEAWGLNKFADYYGIDAKTFLERLEKQYKFTPARFTEIVEEMKRNNEVKIDDSTALEEDAKVGLITSNNVENAENSSDSALIVEPIESEIKAEIMEQLPLEDEPNETAETIDADNTDEMFEIIDETENIEESVNAEETAETTERENDVVQKLKKEYEEHTSEIQKLKDENKEIEESTEEFSQIINNAREKVAELARQLDEQEKIVRNCASSISRNKKKVEEHNQKISKLELRLTSIDEEIKKNQVIRIFCGATAIPDNYTEVWVNGTIPKEEIRNVASDYFKYEEIELVLEDFLLKDFFNTVEFLMQAKKLENENDESKVIEYSFENDKYKEVFDLLRTLK